MYKAEENSVMVKKILLELVEAYMGNEILENKNIKIKLNEKYNE